MSGSPKIIEALLKEEEPIRKLYDSDFRGYRTLNAFTNSKHKFQIDWPKDQRGEQGVQIGVCTIENVNKQTVVRDTWLWELPAKRLTIKKSSPTVDDYEEKSTTQEETPYPVDYKPKRISPHKPRGYLDLPGSFRMELDMDEGSLSFRIDGQDLGVAFKDLRGKRLYLAFFAKRPNFQMAVWKLVAPTLSPF